MLGYLGIYSFLTDVIRQKKPTFIFLCETVGRRSKMEWIQRRLGYEGLFVVEPIGRSGGLALLWKEKEHATLISYSKNHIDVSVSVEDMQKWRLTGFYGEPKRAQRRQTWDLLRNLSRDANLPWCVIGDLNNIVAQEDKKGGAPYPNWLIEGFNQVLMDTGLKDLDLVGHQYTWERGRGTMEWTEVRIDRAMVSQSWLNAFILAKLYNLEDSSTSLDHSPIFLEPKPAVHMSVKRSFKFENAWLSEPMCAQIIKDNWTGYNELGIMDKIQICGDKLGEWGKDITSKFGSRIKLCKTELKQLRGRRDNASVERFNGVKKQLFKIFDQQEIFWRQRSKQLWLKSGDRNNKYFHAMASARKRNNQIQRLKNDAREWKEWNHGLQELISGYFRQLYSSDMPEWDEVIDQIPCTITETQNIELVRPLSNEEVKNALFQMHPDKAPGPDGMTPVFFQNHWHVVGNDVIKVVRQFFTDGTGFRTNVVLLPKKKDPMKITDMRPISLCNVVSKIFTKVMANRLKVLLGNVVSDTQSAFIPGRLISDNIMVSYEVMHYLKRKRRGKDGYMALKLDMSKAYDRVKWGYLRTIMSKMGFSSWWVELVMRCVESVKYDISHGGYDMETILPGRGFRQGDPLSPYLFILCTEGLSAIIRKYEASKWIRGISVCRRAPVITHMLFADDSCVYCKASTGEAWRIIELLGKFERASGQNVNLQKSTVFFSSNTIGYNREEICGILQMSAATEQSTYLGLPNILGKNKSSVLGFLRERVRKRIQSWDGTILSRGGKEVLLKTVVQALPTFAMSVFLLPGGIIKDMENLMNRFWWQSSNNQHKGIHWMEWRRLTVHKSAGGMGFKDLHDYNLSMLGKQGWRLLTNQSSLASRVYKARYYPNGDFLNAPLGNNPSFVWRSIWAAQGLIKSGARWIVGAGRSIDILDQPWLVDDSNPYVTSRMQVLEENMVESLMQVNNRVWDEEILEDLFNSQDMQCILQVPLSPNRDEDRLYWKEEMSVTYTVRSAYKLLQVQKGRWNVLDQSGLWSKFWKIKVPSKVAHVCWRAITGCLPTLSQLYARYVPVQTTCPICNFGEESIIHALVSCSFAASCWQKVLGTSALVNRSMFKDWFEHVLSSYSSDRWAEVVMLCWSVWNARNELVWQQKRARVDSVVYSAKNYLVQWKNAQTTGIITLFPGDNDRDGGTRWVKPHESIIKVSVDAATFSSYGAFGVGLVAINSAGEMVHAQTWRFWGTSPTEFAEALAIKEALSWCKLQGG